MAESFFNRKSFHMGYGFRKKANCGEKISLRFHASANADYADTSCCDSPVVLTLSATAAVENQTELLIEEKLFIEEKYCR